VVEKENFAEKEENLEEKERHVKQENDGEEPSTKDINF